MAVELTLTERSYSEAWEAKRKRDHAAEVAHKKWQIEKAQRDIEEAQRKLKELGVTNV